MNNELTDLADCPIYNTLEVEIKLRSDKKNVQAIVAMSCRRLTNEELAAHLRALINGANPMSVAGYETISHLFEENYGTRMSAATASAFRQVAVERLIPRPPDGGNMNDQGLRGNLTIIDPVRAERERFVSLVFYAQNFVYGERYCDIMDALKLCIWQPDKTFSQALAEITDAKEKRVKGAV